MSVQDDTRERQLADLFNLAFEHDRERSGTDAHLELDEQTIIPFELKSSTTGSVSTARDVGMDHLDKWSVKHWLFGFYTKGGSRLLYCFYASPRLMRPWIEDKRSYIEPDYKLAALARAKLGLEDVYRICGRKEAYNYQDAFRIQKRQYSKEKYLQLMDLREGYSPNQMLRILGDRLDYVCLRGSTLNNPHIPKAYFRSWERIERDHAATLRRMVAEEIADS